TVGVSQAAVDSGQVEASMVKLPLATNARAKMQGFRDGFVKLFARPRSGTVIGGVIVAPRASELILAVSLAVEQMLTVGQMAHTCAVYPSLSGSLTEAARRLMRPVEDRACPRPRTGSAAGLDEGEQGGLELPGVPRAQRRQEAALGVLGRLAGPV